AAFEIVATPFLVGQGALQATAELAGTPKASARRSLAVGGIAALKLALRDTVDPVEVGGALEYEIAVENYGNAPATDVRLEVSLPDALEPLEVRGEIPGAIEKGKLAIGPLAEIGPGERRSTRVRVRAGAAGEAKFSVKLVHPAAGAAGSGGARENESTIVYSPER
ncbi:MAG TPA: hypothetical protein VNC50_18570, partial [Planctomycetia bacterium]|nr:hypothetical protein [Planctomycetia bacterium]